MRNLKITILIIILLVSIALHSQIIVKITKESNEQQNLLESLNLALCIEMTDYLIISIDNTTQLDVHNINYTILSPDFHKQPLYMITGLNNQSLSDLPYLSDIVLNDKNLRIEISFSPKISDTLYFPTIRINKLKISPQIYRNIKTYKYPNSYSRDFKPEWQNIINAVNPDSISWFIQNLENFGTRFAMHENRIDVAQWIADQFIRFGYSDVNLEPFTINTIYGSYNQANVIAQIPGLIFPDRHVVIGAHHDSINQQGGANTWPEIIEISMNYAPGADDNASGVAAVLEIARLVKLFNYQPSSTIRFTTFAMEELGLFGSYFNAEQLIEQNLHVAAMINSDMISYTPSPSWNYNIVNYPQANFLTEIAYEFGIELGMNMYIDDEMMNRSDSWAYYLVGIPSIFFIEREFTPYYHSSNDKYEINVFPEYAQQFVKLITAVSLKMIEMPDNPQNFFLYDCGDGESLKAEWDLVNYPQTSYQLEVKNLDNNVSTYFETSLNTQIINNLIEDAPYEVTLFALINNEYSLGITRFLSPHANPRIVQNFFAEPQKKAILLKWDKNFEMNINKYNIYRKRYQQNDFQLIASVNHEVDNYLDSSTEDFTTYQYKILAFNTNNNYSPDSEVISVKHLAFQDKILVVDITNHHPTNLLYPEKTLTDQFYTELLYNYEFDDIYYPDINQISIQDLGQYNTIIIYKNSFNIVSSTLLKNTLYQYIEFEGNIIISANDCLQILDEVGNEFPLVFNPHESPYQIFGINTVFFNTSTRLSTAHSSGWNNLPDLEVDSIKLPPNLYGKLFRIEAYEGSYLQEIYTYQSNSSNPNESAFDGKTVALFTKKNNSQIFLTSIPLYYTKQQQAKELMQSLLNDFTTSNTDYTQPNHALLDLKNYPNPFNPSTSIQFTLIQNDKLSLNIYNIKGQLIWSFPKKYFPAGKHELVWNGKDFHGNNQPSGIYFYQIVSQNFQETKKMLLLK